MAVELKPINQNEIHTGFAANNGEKLKASVR
jgi:hypothetical protein